MTDFEVEFDISRTASDYEATSHLIRRIRERKILEEDMVAEAIEDGEIVDVNKNPEGDGRTNAVIRNEWLFTTYEVVIGVEEMKVQTAYEVES